ncbi:MAG: efflux RND transporter periplasmic adaptor subunit [Campylobacteraceae bacterium]|jgi:membrane fusion protein (multidrug efflux system)|nr:efflux RND transporter periplasmic adaptor subunit [Campylobacteraceae bacterium]
MVFHKLLQIKYGIVVISLFTLVFAGCSDNKAANTANAAQQMPPLPVNTFKTQIEDISISLEYPAKIKSVQQVQVVAKVPGTLEKKFFQEGSFVTEGTQLYQIDPSKYEAAYDLAKAQLSIAQAAAKEADRNWQRTEQLYAKNALSQREYDAALNAYETTKAQVEAANASFKNAKVDLEYTKVKATASGNIGENLQDLGSYVGISSANSILAVITQTNPVYAEFSIPDLDLLKRKYSLNKGNWDNILKAKLPVKVITPAGDKYDNLGTFDFLDILIDPQTSTIKARATFENKNKILIPGLFVRVSIEGLALKDALSIPQKAVMQDPLGSYVYVLREGKAKKVPIKTDISVADGKIVILEGLKENEEIIIDNLTKIKHDADVVPAALFAQMMAAKANTTANAK